jgi:glucan 1,3-beta-glucosidase
LKILAERFRCVRTYSVAEGLDEVPKIARGLGLKVMLGLWISSHAPSNDKEIERGIALANEYADVVTAVIVGNEVLLRREQTPAQLRALIERVRAGTAVPITYADVWEFWLRNADLAQVTNFVTIHILPYWEDNPVGIDHALEHVQRIYAEVQAAFPGRVVFIGETGWPSAGRPRLQAVPGLINEARLIREFVVFAEREKIPYNLIEAFDQPWKRIQEGTVGGYWGLYSADGAAKFSFTGPVIAQASWRIGLKAAVVGFVLFVLGGVLLTPRPSTRAFALLGIAGYVAGSVLYQQWLYMATANRTWLEWVATSVWATCGWLAYIFACFAFACWIDGVSQLHRPASIASAVRSWRQGVAATEMPNRLLGVLRLLVLLGAAYVCLALTYEGRGRDFPLALTALPIMVLALLELFTAEHIVSRAENEERILTLSIALTTIYIAWHETWVNTRAMLWCALCLLLVATLCIGMFRSRVSGQRFIGTGRPMYPHKGAEQNTHTAEIERI